MSCRPRIEHSPKEPSRFEHAPPASSISCMPPSTLPVHQQAATPSSGTHMVPFIKSPQPGAHRSCKHHASPSTQQPMLPLLCPGSSIQAHAPGSQGPRKSNPNAWPALGNQAGRPKQQRIPSTFDQGPVVASLGVSSKQAYKSLYKQWPSLSQLPWRVLPCAGSWQSPPGAAQAPLLQTPVRCPYCWKPLPDCPWTPHCSGAPAWTCP